jgi:hypothetical protein
MPTNRNLSFRNFAFLAIAAALGLFYLCLCQTERQR